MVSPKKRFDTKHIARTQAMSRQYAMSIGLNKVPIQDRHALIGYNATTGKMIMSSAAGNQLFQASLITKELPAGIASTPLSDGQTVLLIEYV